MNRCGKPLRANLRCEYPVNHEGRCGLPAVKQPSELDAESLRSQLSECQRDLANGGMSEKRLRLKDMSARKLPFQSGDVVKTPRGTGTIEAIGQLGEGTVVYRVGKRQYWFSWQLLHVRRQI